jgi:hypothetical protein
MAAVGLTVAIPVTLLIRGGDDDGDAASSTPSQAATLPALNPTPVTDESLGITVRIPETWSASQKAGAIRLRSVDRTMLMTISAPAAAGAAAEVLHTAVEAVKADYDDATGIPSAGRGLSGKRIGNLPAFSAALLARTEGGTQLRILVSAASGQSHTYLVELFSALSSHAARLTEAQAVLNSLQFSG